MLRTVLVTLALVSAAVPALAQNLTAIDVLIRPGPEMMQVAADWNAKMREQSPEGFQLDPEHAPHITLVQRFVATADVDKVLEAVDAVKMSVTSARSK